MELPRIACPGFENAAWESGIGKNCLDAEKLGMTRYGGLCGSGRHRSRLS
jgi:hypothetical protein